MCWARSIWHNVQKTQLPGWHQRKSPEQSVYFGESPNPASDFRCVPFDWLHQWGGLNCNFYIILFSWLSISEWDTFISLSAELITCNFFQATQLWSWIMAWKVRRRLQPHTGVVQKPVQIFCSFCFHCWHFFHALKRFHVIGAEPRDWWATFYNNYYYELHFFVKYSMTLKTCSHSEESRIAQILSCTRRRDSISWLFTAHC